MLESSALYYIWEPSSKCSQSSKLLLAGKNVNLFRVNNGATKIDYEVDSIHNLQCGSDVLSICTVTKDKACCTSFPVIFLTLSTQADQKFW